MNFPPFWLSKYIFRAKNTLSPESHRARVRIRLSEGNHLRLRIKVLTQVNQFLLMIFYAIIFKWIELLFQSLFLLGTVEIPKNLLSKLNYIQCILKFVDRPLIGFFFHKSRVHKSDDALYIGEDWTKNETEISAYSKIIFY